jgi:hypothetical protein
MKIGRQIPYWTNLNTTERGADLLFSISYFLVFALYIVVAYQSYGYDDDVFNIKLIEQYGFAAAKITQGTDVHPPLSYIANAALYWLTHSWTTVRVIDASLCALSIAYAVKNLRRTHGDTVAATAMTLLGPNPALLLWCTGLRWYALFVPILIWLSIVPNTHGWFRWAKLCTGLLLLAYISYAAFIVAIPLLYLYARSSDAPWQEDFKPLLWIGAIALLMYIPQLFIFFDVHLANEAGQRSSLFRGLVGLVSTYISNQGVFPLSFTGSISAVGSIGLYTVLCRDEYTGAFNRHFESFSIGAAFAWLSGLAGKFHNLVVFIPWQILAISTATARRSLPLIYYVSLTLVLIGNIAGSINVISHSNTIKNSWNLPVGDIVRRAESARDRCGGDILIATQDSLIAFILKRESFQVLSPYAAPPAVALLPTKLRCVVILKTYAGSIPEDRYRTMFEQVSRLSASSKKEERLYEESNYIWKRRLDPRYPKYQVEWLEFKDVSNISILTTWNGS